MTDEHEGMFTGVCDFCGKTTRVFLANNPFLEEIHDEITEDETWCTDCYQESCDDI